MIVKKDERHDPIGEAVRNLRRLQIFLGWKLLGLIIVSSFAVVLTILASIAIYTNEGARVLNRITDLRMYPAVLFQYAKAQLYVADGVELDVKHMDMQKILYSRATRLDPDTPRIDAYVPVKFRYNNQTLKGKMRLKGDRKIHFEDIDKMSFRVKMKGEDTLWGMKTFSLQKPRTRNYVHEWIFHRMMEEQGLAALRYKFINLTLNGKNLGTYAVEEHFGKELIENHNRREGPIIRFLERKDGDFRSSRIMPYNEEDWQDADSLPLVERATFLLSGFQRGELTLDQTFDTRKLARFFAVNDLLGTYHAGVSKSMRLYYNPISGKLEPIPYDGHFGTIFNPVLSSELGLSLEAGRWTYTTDRDWLRAIFRNQTGTSEIFYAEYIDTLTSLTSPDFLDDFFARNQTELADNLAMIYRDMPLADNVLYFGPEPHYFSKRRLYRRQAILRKRLDTFQLDAHLVREDNDQVIVDVTLLIGAVPISITSISCGSAIYSADIQSIIFPSTDDIPDKPLNITFTKPAQSISGEPNTSCDSLNYQTIGSRTTGSTDIYPWPSYSSDTTASDFLLANETTKTPVPHAELDKGGSWVIRSGDYTFSRDVIIPPDTLLIIEAGVKLSFENGAILYSRSPIDFQGTMERPVLVRSNDEISGGIAILNAPTISTWSHVQFSNLTNPDKVGWSVPGAVTLYESPIVMNDVIFSDNRSEDSLNIVRSEFALNDIEFSNSYSDALDLDFSEGTIDRAKFHSSGNDAIDMSGSTVSVRDLHIGIVGDKAISVGEASSATFQRVNIEDAEIGITSKDNSVLQINEATLSRVKLGLIAFQKKPEYGPGKIVATGVTLNDVEIPYLVEENSEVYIEESLVPPSGDNLRDILYGVKFGKASG